NSRYKNNLPITLPISYKTCVVIMVSKSGIGLLGVQRKLYPQTSTVPMNLNFTSSHSTVKILLEPTLAASPPSNVPHILRSPENCFLHTYVYFVEQFCIIYCITVSK